MSDGALAAKRPLVVVAIAVHNRLVLTSQCLQCLGPAAGSADLKVLVVDDGSTDGTGEWLRVHVPDAIILPGNGGLWFGGSLQKAIDYVKARMPQADYCMSLNNDTFLLPGCIDALIAESKGHATVQAVLLDRAGSKIHSAGDVWHSWKGWTDPLRGGDFIVGREAMNQRPRNVQMLNGTATLIPMKWLVKAQRIDAIRYPHSRADTDLIAKVAREGSPLRVSSSAIATNDDETKVNRYSIRKKSLGAFLRETLTDRLCPMHLPASLSSTWETAPSRLKALPVMTRFLLLYMRQILILIALTPARPLGIDRWLDTGNGHR